MNGVDRTWIVQLVDGADWVLSGDRIEISADGSLLLIDRLPSGREMVTIGFASYSWRRFEMQPSGGGDPEVRP